MISELYAKNLRWFAKVGDWPDGVVAELIALHEDYPGWHVTWSRGGLPRWREAGFYAWPDEWRKSRCTVHRKDPAQLREVFEMCPAPTWRDGWAPPGGWLGG